MTCDDKRKARTMAGYVFQAFLTPDNLALPQGLEQTRKTPENAEVIAEGEAIPEAIDADLEIVIKRWNRTSKEVRNSILKLIHPKSEQ